MLLTKSVKNAAILKKIFNLKIMPFCTRLTAITQLATSAKNLLP